ncbi:LamG-like jellyroll fold domain-containing protein [Streptomyces sp. NBC_00347]|uniref:LamG-like jellyroll fold domain-containing protein n=1 Tax=Streptomyces sp. NBC_00347 TaxID=2975721 RepID=UPI00225255AB|nr:LamG-like jellyroll fold domain-containing protein [Streptomyces sp. NBC_00347]MCX5129992.1 ricin-type beta-trefoil lectin domain protein [Streptomyces sp. NBC_00347]
MDTPPVQSEPAPQQQPRTEREQAEDAALAEAKLTGKPVPVPAVTTETDTVVANPDGTLGMTRSVAPVRTKHDGGWVDLDATLVKAADGTLRPKASASSLTLSGGGTGPLATLDQDGKRLVVSWPDPLPVPVLEESSAVYREVLPGADLKVTADVGGGISQILIVKSAEAARNPKLAKLTTGLKGEGVTVSADAAGNLKAADASGRTVFQAPTPTMWDSTTPVQVPLAKPSGTIAFSQAVTADETPSGTGDEEAVKTTSDSDGPGDFAKTTRLQADLGTDSVALTPNQSFLTAPDTAYPVYIDPAWVPTNRKTQHWAWVQEAYPTTTNYDDYADDYDPGVGYQQWRTRTGLERYYIQLDTGDLNDKVIKKASFNATQSYAADATCSNRYNVDLHSTEPLLSNITWNTQPRDWEVLGTASMNSAGGPGCPSSTTLGEWDVAGHLAANMWRGSVTYALFADNESKTSSNNGFKRFTRDKTKLPFFYIEYNRAPMTPWGLAMTPAPQNGGWVGATAYPGMSISAWSGDPDGQATSARFMVYDTNGSGAVYDSAMIGEANGDHKVTAYPANLIDGHQYLWQVQSSDGELGSAWVEGGRFSMDSQPPSIPVVTSSEYPPSGTLPGSKKYAGQKGNFKVEATDSLSGVLFYEWAFNSSIPVGGANRINAAADGTATIPLTPTWWGTNILRVQSVDRAGNRSQQQTYVFYVPDNPNAKTTLGDITGDELVDFIAPDDDNGNLIVYPTATDPSAGGVIASTKADSPGGLGWDKALATHRGGNGIIRDDLWAYGGGQLRYYRNSMDEGGLDANDGLYFVKDHGDPVTRPAIADCTVAATSKPCSSTAYSADWSRVKEIVAVGDVLPKAGVDPLNDLLAIESTTTGDAQLILHQGGAATGALINPLILSSTGWDNFTLMAPGDATGDGLADLWARDDITGEVWQYANVAGKPAALGDHTKRTKIGSGVPASSYPVIGTSGDTSADDIPDLWALDGRHRLRTWNGKVTSGKVTAFAGSELMGDARISSNHWKLDEKEADGTTGPTVFDMRRRNNGTLSATGATRIAGTVAGTATQVVNLDGATGTVTTTGSPVDTTGSFTVSAWAKSAGKDVVLSQDGLHASGFMIWHDADGTWRFGMSKRDDDGWDYDQTGVMNDAAKVALNEWTQLTATYDATTGLIALYVNGTLAGTGHHPKANVWKATGPLVLGRFKNQSKPWSFWKGQISNVTVYKHSTVPTATSTTLVSAVNSNKCADDDRGSNAEGNRIYIHDCNTTPGISQTFQIQEDGELRVAGKCVTAADGGTANRTLIQLNTCTAAAAGSQQWLPTATSGFYNPQSGRCLDLPYARTVNGTQLELSDCNGSNAQRWHAAGLASPLGAIG